MPPDIRRFCPPRFADVLPTPPASAPRLRRLVTPTVCSRAVALSTCRCTANDLAAPATSGGVCCRCVYRLRRVNAGQQVLQLIPANGVNAVSCFDCGRIGVQAHSRFPGFIRFLTVHFANLFCSGLIPHPHFPSTRSIRSVSQCSTTSMILLFLNLKTKQDSLLWRRPAFVHGSNGLFVVIQLHGYSNQKFCLQDAKRSQHDAH